MSFPVSSAALKAAIPPSVGDPGTGVVALNIDTIWAMFQEKATIHPMLQFYYAQREAMRWTMRAAAAKPTMRIGGMQIDYSTVAQTLERELNKLDSEIASYEGATPGSSAMAQITRHAPIQGTDTFVVPSSNVPLDANDPTIQGNPYLIPPYPIR